MAMPNFMTLDWEQLDAILRQLDKPDWWSILSQALVAILAIAGGYFAQHGFEKRRERKEFLLQVYKFNEAVGWLGAYMQETYTNYRDLLFEQFVHEKKVIESLDNKSYNAQPLAPLHFTTIRGLAIPDHVVIANKVYPSENSGFIYQFFYTLENYTTQYKYLAELREEAIINFCSDEGHKLDNPLTQYKVQQIFDATTKMLATAEVILDALAKIDELMQETRLYIKKEAKRMGHANAKISYLAENKFYMEFRAMLKELFDNMPGYEKRVLFMHRDKDKKATSSSTSPQSGTPAQGLDCR